jgi:preprotein translocase subunit SecE
MEIVGFYRKGIEFLREVRAEARKVTWPARKETIASTSVVLVAVFLIALFLGLVDLGLSRLVGQFMK